MTYHWYLKSFLNKMEMTWKIYLWVVLHVWAPIMAYHCELNHYQTRWRIISKSTLVWFLFFSLLYIYYGLLLWPNIIIRQNENYLKNPLVFWFAFLYLCYGLSLWPKIIINKIKLISKIHIYSGLHFFTTYIMAYHGLSKVIF